jgi:hypothetical protein
MSKRLQEIKNKRHGDMWWSITTSDMDYLVACIKAKDTELENIKQEYKTYRDMCGDEQLREQITEIHDRITELIRVGYVYEYGVDDFITCIEAILEGTKLKESAVASLEG